MIIAKLAFISSALTAVLFFIGRAYFKSIQLRVLLIYILTSGIVDVITSALGLLGIANITIINTFYLFQFIMLLLFLLWEFKNLLVLLLMITTMIATIFYSVLDIYNNIGLLKIAGKSISIQAFVLSLTAILALLSRTFKTNLLLTQDPFFWFTSAIILYFSLSALAFVTSEIRLENAGTIRKYTWMINSFATIFSNVLYLVGLRCLKTQVKSSLPSI